MQIKGITEVSGGKSRHFGFADDSTEKGTPQELSQTDASPSKNVTDLLKGTLQNIMSCATAVVISMP